MSNSTDPYGLGELDEPEYDEADAAPAETRPARPAAKRRGRGRRGWIVVGVLGLILLLIAGTGAIYYNNLRNAFDTKSTTLTDVFPDDGRPESNGKSINILLLGSDKRAQAVDPKVAVAGGGADERTDSIMVVNISGDRKHVTVMSIMRDLWVDIPGHGKAKINAGYAFGGRKLEVQTVENFLKVRMDHVMLVDMESFKEFADAVGGLDVNVELPSTLHTVEGQPVLKPGVQHLDGTQVLGLARERHSYPTGDYQRVRNQHAVISALAKKILSKETLMSPTKVEDLVYKTSPFLSHDKGLDFNTAVKIGFDLRALKSSDIKFATMPTNGVSWSDDGQSIVLVNPEGLASVTKAFKDDTLDQWVESKNNTEKKG